MDVKWFKAQQKKAGVTADVIAKRMGRDRSAVSHIYKGERRMSLDWAKAFSDALSVPLDEVLRHAGELDEVEHRAPKSLSFTESDVTPWHGRGNEVAEMLQISKLLGAGGDGVDVWTVKSNCLSLNGYLPGDHVAVDKNMSELCRAGDIVLVHRYNIRSGQADTLLRRFEPPVLVAANIPTEDDRVLIMDGNNVAIRGKVIASWRT